MTTAIILILKLNLIHWKSYNPYDQFSSLQASLLALIQVVIVGLQLCIDTQQLCVMQIKALNFVLLT